MIFLSFGKISLVFFSLCMRGGHDKGDWARIYSELLSASSGVWKRYHDWIIKQKLKALFDLPCWFQ